MATHGWTLEFTDDVHTVYDCYERHSRMIFPEAQPSPRHPGHGTITPKVRDYFLVRHGIDPDSVATIPAARAAIAEAIRRRGPDLGCDFSELSESQLNDDFHYTIFPNVTLNIHAEFTWVFTHRPHPGDPNRMYFDFLNLVRMPSHDVARPEKERLRVDDGISLAHAADEGWASVHPDADRDPRLARAVPGALEEVSSGPDRRRGVPSACEPRDEERDCRVADELVHDPVVLVDHFRGSPVEAGEQLRVLAGRHLLGERG